MKNSAPQTVRLSDYAPPPWLVDTVHLTFRLHPNETRVLSRIAFRPNPANPDPLFHLDGENLQLIRAMVDGTPVTPRVDDRGLTVAVPDAPFIWECEVEIDPEANTALEGLYMSKGMFCSQCEAEGFRRITYYPDRPDVMATFTVRIESDLPVLLSNGNPSASGPGWAEWHDPWPKPSYLFALVAGNLRARSGQFRTMEGRDVALNIWVRSGDEDRCDYALDCLERSMLWDEKVYGRAYDLDVFNLVAVEDFNAGAMENKGLNIFNAKYVLASPETATDRDYEFIEGIIAHEYFHNWTGNRITCRDWFQLCLKEGLTVFRDQQFSGDMRSHAVKRIDDVLALRARQFREDNGPLAHPVRPEAYQEINNFYTATVYEKGAEVIGMLKTLIGDDAYYQALNLYFERHDGQACTIEDWLKVFEDATGSDLGQFSLWYSQAGTPRIDVEENFNNGTYTITFEQKNSQASGQPDKSPLVIPIATGLLAQDGTEIVPTRVLELRDLRQSFVFEGLNARPVPSLLRGFSAPVILDRATSEQERVLLLACDTDPFNRWEAGRQLGKDVLVRRILGRGGDNQGYFDALRQMASDDTLDPAFRALALGLPSEDDLAQSLFDAGTTPDPLVIHGAREALLDDIARALDKTLLTLFDTMAVPGPYTPDATSAGCRALRLTALSLLSRTHGPERAASLFDTADNMTESFSALALLVKADPHEKRLATFYDRWEKNPNVLDKWFAVQVTQASPETAVTITRHLTRHADFDWKTPNRFRAVIGALGQNVAGFHDRSGAGYRFLAEWLCRLDPMNPQTAARMATLFETWRRYDADRQEMMRDALETIRRKADLSPDMREIVDRILGDSETAH
jgi:aminopeptidase N